MKILVISDIHSHNENLQKALDVVPQKSIEHIFCLGDVIGYDTALMLAQEPTAVTLVLGNNDRDWSMFREIETLYPDSFRVIFHDDGGEIEIENTHYYLTHYPRVANDMALTGKYKTIFHGHSHQPRDEVIGDTRIINPGDLLNRHGDAGFAIYDTKTHEVEFVSL